MKHLHLLILIFYFNTTISLNLGAAITKGALIPHSTNTIVQLFRTLASCTPIIYTPRTQLGTRDLTKLSGHRDVVTTEPGDYQVIKINKVSRSFSNNTNDHHITVSYVGEFVIDANNHENNVRKPFNQIQFLNDFNKLDETVRREFIYDIGLIGSAYMKSSYRRSIHILDALQQFPENLQSYFASIISDFAQNSASLQNDLGVSVSCIKLYTTFECDQNNKQFITKLTTLVVGYRDRSSDGLCCSNCNKLSEPKLNETLNAKLNLLSGKPEEVLKLPASATTDDAKKAYFQQRLLAEGEKNPQMVEILKESYEAWRARELRKQLNAPANTR